MKQVARFYRINKRMDHQIFSSQQKHQQLKIFAAAVARLKNIEIPDDLPPLPQGDRPETGFLS